jgi:hypothetical protein
VAKLLERAVRGVRIKKRITSESKFKFNLNFCCGLQMSGRKMFLNERKLSRGVRQMEIYSRTLLTIGWMTG